MRGRVIHILTAAWVSVIRPSNLPLTWLCALTQLDLDHLDLRVRRILLEHLWAELTLPGPAAEVPGADVPDNVAPTLLVEA